LIYHIERNLAIHSILLVSGMYTLHEHGLKRQIPQNLLKSSTTTCRHCRYMRGMYVAFRYLCDQS